MMVARPYSQIVSPFGCPPPAGPYAMAQTDQKYEFKLFNNMPHHQTTDATMTTNNDTTMTTNIDDTTTTNNDTTNHNDTTRKSNMSGVTVNAGNVPSLHVDGGAKKNRNKKKNKSILPYRNPDAGDS